MDCKVYEQKIAEMITTLRDREYKTIEEGEQLAEAIRSEAEKMNDPFLMGNSLSALAEFAYMKGEDSDTVFSYGIGAIPYLESVNDALGLTRTYNILAIEYYLRGFMIGAMENFLKSLSYSMQVENGSGHIGVEYLNIANVYHSMGDNDTALEYALMCIPMIEASDIGKNRRRNLSLAYSLTGMLYMELKADVDEAENYSRKSLELLNEFDADDYDAPYNEYWLLRAMIEEHRGNREAFRKVVEQLIELLHKIGIHGDEIDTIADFLDYLTRVKEVELFNRLSAFYDEMDEEIACGYRARLLSDKIQCAKYMGKMEEAAQLALLYYEASQEQEEMYELAGLQSIREKKVMNDIREENKRLAELAETDALTGLPNRYHLNRHSDQLFEKAYNNKTNLAVEILDVDYFKQFNDTLGHQAGDECIKQIAGVLKDMAAADSRIFAARYGGDEFVILYDGMEDEEVLWHAEMLRTKVTELAIAHPATASGLVSVTQGVRNSISAEKNKLWDYMFTADNALYEAKKEHKGEIMLLKKASMSQATIDKAKYY